MSDGKAFTFISRKLCAFFFFPFVYCDCWLANQPLLQHQHTTTEYQNFLSQIHCIFNYFSTCKHILVVASIWIPLNLMKERKKKTMTTRKSATSAQYALIVWLGWIHALFCRSRQIRVNLSLRLFRNFDSAIFQNEKCANCKNWREDHRRNHLESVCFCLPQTNTVNLLSITKNLLFSLFGKHHFALSLDWAKGKTQHNVILIDKRKKHSKQQQKNLWSNSHFGLLLH